MMSDNEDIEEIDKQIRKLDNITHAIDEVELAHILRRLVYVNHFSDFVGIYESSVADESLLGKIKELSGINGEIISCSRDSDDFALKKHIFDEFRIRGLNIYKVGRFKIAYRPSLNLKSEKDQPEDKVTANTEILALASEADMQTIPLYNERTGKLLSPRS